MEDNKVYDPSEKDNRPFLAALVYEKDGDLNLTWLFVMVMGLIGSIAFLYANIIAPMFGYPINVPVQLAAWSFLAGAFASVLIAAIPYAKAKILAKATLPAELAKAAGSPGNVETSTDIQELSQNGRLQTPPLRDDSI